MNNKTSPRLHSLALLLALALPAAHAADVVMKTDEVTERALIQALDVEATAEGKPKPEPHSDSESEQPAIPSGKRRGFKLSTEAAAASTRPVGRASLLITFDTNSAVLTAESHRLLDTLAKALQSDKLAALNFRVEGHADPRGHADANQRLSQLRAEAVVAHLVAQFGIRPERLQALGKGSSELLNTTRTDAPENRRVTIVSSRS